jgi:hypothetical protein
MSALEEIIAAEARTATFPAAQAFADHLVQRFGAEAVIFYGSCLRQNTDQGLLLDFYALVESTQAALGAVSGTFARLLPPNVYYIEMPFEGRIVRAKVAVMATDQFLDAVKPETFTASIWARFAQPARVLCAKSDALRAQLERSLAQAVATMMANAQPLMTEVHDARALWVRAFTATYGAELRPEKESKAAELVAGDLARYEGVSRAALGPGPYPAATPAQLRAGTKAWKRRRILGKTLNALRLIKAAFTFQGGLDYAVWKIERHSGVKITLTPAERKRPLLTGLRLFLGTLRQGGLR